MELETMLYMQHNACCNVLVKDLDDKTIEANIFTIQEAKKQICNLAEKYGTSKDELSLHRVTKSKRAKIWATLTDALSGKMKRYGIFPNNYAEEHDSDINKLMEITNRLK